MIVGYARVSTAGQDLEVQRNALLELGTAEENIYVDHGFSGRSMTRSGLDQARVAVRRGDTFVVPRLDRLARNVEGALQIMRELTERGVVFQNGRQVYDPSDPMSKMVMTILAAVAEAEGGWISLRTREALARPSVRAKMRGRRSKLTIKDEDVILREMQSREYTVSELAGRFKVSRPAIYRAFERAKARGADDKTGE